MVQLQHTFRRFPLAVLLALLTASGCDPDTQDDDTSATDDDDTSPIDLDGDGYTADEDCDDEDPAVHPGAHEVCDGLDNDCNDVIDDSPDDTDGDGFTDCVDPTPEGFDGGEGREQPLSMQLHLHGSLSEFDGSMGCHTLWAETYGVHVLWWSDHDNMLAMVQRGGGYDFDTGTLTEELTQIGLTYDHGMVAIETTLDDTLDGLEPGGPSGYGWFWRIGGTDGVGDQNWRHTLGAYASETGFAHQVPLLADTSGTLQLRLGQPASEDWQFRFKVFLSNTCGGIPNTITWFIGGDDLTEDDTTTDLHLPLSLDADEWTELAFDLTETADYFTLREDQLAMAWQFEVRVRNGISAHVDIDDFQLAWVHAGDDLRTRQRELLDERYSDGSVTHYVGQEMSVIEDSQHLNPLGEDRVPLLDLESTGEISATEGTTHIHDHGGLAMCNHPFGTALSVQYEGEKADLLTELMVEEYAAAAAHGCDLVEVGYPRRIVDLEHHLMFWDLLALEGYPLVGLGTSDHHWYSDWWEFSNPFVSWVFLDAPDRARIVDQLERGRAFFGNPVAFGDEQPLLDLWTEHGAVMGETLVSDLDQVLHVETGYLEVGWAVELVVDGDVSQSVLLAGDEVDTVFELPRGDARVVRAQLLDDNGVIVLVSNPIYLEMP